MPKKNIYQSKDHLESIDSFPLHEKNYGNRHTDDGLNFFIEFVDRLNTPTEPIEFLLADGGKIDLRNIFRDFLNHVFANETLPEFLEMLRRDIPLVEELKSHDKITHLQKDARSEIIEYANRSELVK